MAVAEPLALRTCTEGVLHAALGLTIMGMAGWGWPESVSMRVVAIDSVVNLVGKLAASFAGVWRERGSAWLGK